MLRRKFDLKLDDQRFAFLREMFNFTDFIDEFKEHFPEYNDYDEKGYDKLNVKGKSLKKIDSIVKRKNKEDEAAAKGDQGGAGKGKSAAGPADADVSCHSGDSKTMFDRGVYECDSIRQALGHRGISVVLAHSSVSPPPHLFCYFLLPFLVLNDRNVR